MDSIVKPYLFRASAVALSVVVMGFCLSLVVYNASNNVRKNAVELVDNRIPTLTSINQLMADLNEQERIIYEFYSTLDVSLFQEHFNANKAVFDMHRQAIANQPLFTEQHDEIILTQQKIETVIQTLEFEIDKREDWDYIRELLVEISNERRLLQPVLLSIEEQTKQLVLKAHQQTMSQLGFTHDLVAVFGFSILLLGGLVAWYSKQYIITNAKNDRLALFSQRNPNPILSVDAKGDVVFFNPASINLLQQVGFSEANIEQLLPHNFDKLRNALKDTSSNSIVVEQALSTKLLQINVNWLQDVDSYDMHIIDITEKRESEKRILALAYHNQETSLPNVYQMNDDLEALINKKSPFVHGLFTIRHFTQLVTSYGDDAVQKLVTLFANQVRASLSKEVMLYQLNERLFAVVCEEKPEDMSSCVLAIVDNINRKIEQSITTEFGDFTIEIDYGFSKYPKHAISRTHLVKASRTALTYASRSEHQHWLFFDEVWSKEISAKANLLKNLRNAVTNNELFLVFQPQLNLATKTIIGIETLVRWRHQGEIISPVDFIPIAEQSGVIVSIGEWILNEACKFTKQLINEGHENIVVAVNVSPRQFSHPDFLTMVERILTDTGLSPKNLELEITEGVFMHQEGETLKVLNNLKKLGVQLSIDDFGTGYSSLSYLKQFPIDKLKIDQSFIKDSHTNDEDRALVSTIIALGKSLGLLLIAEGVELAEHETFLTSLQCDEIQGYYFSRPLEQAALITFLTEKCLTDKKSA